MAAPTNFETFVNALNQLEQDQTLFESQVGSDELQGVQHEEIIKLGGIMSKRMQKLAEKGQTFADSLPTDFLPKLVDAIQTYQNLIMPPKVFGGFCPCLKPARSGVEYDKKFSITKAKMVSSIFLVQAVLIENKGEQHNMDSMHYADYVNKMNKVFDNLQDIKCGGGEKGLENARKKLLAAVENVDKFVQHFGESGGKVEFKAEALRRIRAAQELLTTRQSSAEGVALPIGKRVLIKAQSSLQEIMNSAAAIASTQAKENLSSLSNLTNLLKKSREIEVNQFNAMEEQMNELNLMDVLSRLREDCEIVHSDASSKLRDAIKRWTTIKNQAVPRKVAEYKEEESHSNAMVVPGMNQNPQKIFQETGKKLGTVGKFAEKITKEAVSGTSLVLNDVKNLGKSGVDGVKNVGDNMKNAAKKVGKALNIEDGGPPSSNNSTGSNKKPASAAKRMANPFEAMMGSDSDAPTTRKTSSGYSKLNPLDAF